MVLGGGANHGWAADVDVLQGQCIGGVRLGDGGGEGIQIDDDQIDGRYAVLGHCWAVNGATAKDAAVNLRMQGLDPSVHDFREAGVGRDFRDRQAGGGDGLGGAASR